MSRVYEAVDAAYAAACSDGTLCSGARGFFRGLAEEMVAAAAADGALDALEAAPPAAKLAAVLENKQVQIFDTLLRNEGTRSIDSLKELCW